MSAQHTPGPLVAVKLEDRSAFNIFAPGYATAIATVSSQSNAHGCMGSTITQQYAFAMAAGPELLAALEEARNGLLWYQESYPTATDGSDDEAMARINAAIAKATRSAP